MIKKERPTNIKEWHSDDEKRLCVFGPEKDMVATGMVEVVGEEEVGEGVILIRLFKDDKQPMGWDEATARVRVFDNMEQAKAFAERWCEQ